MKKKVKLSLEDLQLDSFVTTPGTDGAQFLKPQWDNQAPDTTLATCRINPDIPNGITAHTCRFTWEMTCLPGTTTCCADESAPGYASCGTTCQDATMCMGAPCGVTQGCPSPTSTCATQGDTCNGTCDGTCTAPGFAC